MHLLLQKEFQYSFWSFKILCIFLQSSEKLSVFLSLSSLPHLLLKDDWLLVDGHYLVKLSEKTKVFLCLKTFTKFYVYEFALIKTAKSFTKVGIFRFHLKSFLNSRFNSTFLYKFVFNILNSWEKNFFRLLAHGESNCEAQLSLVLVKVVRRSLEAKCITWIAKVTPINDQT